MESWSYVLRGKGFVSDDSVSATGGIARSSRNNLMGSELKSPWSYGSTVMCSSHEGVENQDFVDLGSSDMMRKSLPSDSIGDIFAGKISCGIEISSITAPPNAFSGEDESCSKLSSSIVESNCRESSSLIDLKLGRLSDQRDGKNFSSSELTPKFSSAESLIPAKRTRAGGLTSQTPYCQVHGCRKDLSSSKDYHKRHKVCEIHSKTPKVIVNGIEQRFCQQCSRFHLLDEFDDGKRSCRKRLAGHNERRRKPQMRMHAGRVGRLFQSFDATRYQGNEFSASSFVCEDILPSGLLPQQKYEISNSSRLLKLEDGADLTSRLAIPTTNGVMQPKSLFTSNYSGKQCPSLLDDGISASARNKINENSSYLQEIAVSDFVSRSVFHNSSLGNEDMTVLDSSSTIHGLSDISNSGRALSLLSSQSLRSSSHSSGIQTALPLITSGRRALYPITQQPEKLLGLSSQAPTIGMSTLFHSSLMSSMEENHMDPIVISAGGSAVSSGIGGIIQQSPNINGKSQFSCTDLSTINLLQLSSQLQRVEHQRESLLMKQEDDAFSGLRST